MNSVQCRFCRWIRTWIVRPLCGHERVSTDEILLELEREDLELNLELARIDAAKSRAALQRAERLSRESAISQEDIESARFELDYAPHLSSKGHHDQQASYLSR